MEVTESEKFIQRVGDVIQKNIKPFQDTCLQLSDLILAMARTMEHEARTTRDDITAQRLRAATKIANERLSQIAGGLKE